MLVKFNYGHHFSKEKNKYVFELRNCYWECILFSVRWLYLIPDGISPIQLKVVVCQDHCKYFTI